MNKKTEQYIVPGLVRGLAVLQVFDNRHKELSMAEIAERIGLNRSSVFRLVYTLENDGFLQRIAGGNRYRLGARVLDLGFRFLTGLDMLEPARPILTRLCDDTRMTAHLVIRDGTDIVYVDRYQANTPFTSTVSVGTRFPAYATTPGQIQLTGLGESQIRRLFQGIEMQPFTSRTPTSIEALLERLEHIRPQPAVVSWGHFDTRISACTAPVLGRGQKIVAAVSVSCPIGSVAREELEGGVRDSVIRASRALSKTQGWFAG
ncbi:IclR family transcriptional regulator [Marinobacterium aestuariivivens]|uniref:IclR family transcriptional regulator n=1 Tax=Marinobacterium aestuariivivens TaxID=1698799 RepID=A0ABW1ZXC1_9GAMM